MMRTSILLKQDEISDLDSINIIELKLVLETQKKKNKYTMIIFLYVLIIFFSQKPDLWK